MRPVYKVNSLGKDNIIKDIYVFAGLTKEKTKELNELIKQADIKELIKNEDLLSYFSTDELKYINENDVNVEYVDIMINGDDTIDVVKRKILLANNVSNPFDSIYMFGKITKSLSSVSTYQTLTQNGRIELTKLRFIQFLINIGYDETDISKIKNKETYTYDDILALGLEQKEWIVSIPIGQHFVAVEGTYPYNVNPFNVDSFDPLLINSVSNMVTTSNGQLLMDYNGLIENNIFICLTTNTMEYVSNKGLQEETAIRIYYPFLATQNILNLDDYNEQVSTLIRESKKLVDKTFTSSS